MTIDTLAQLKTLSQQHPGKIEQLHWKQETGGDSPKDRYFSSRLQFHMD